MNTHDVIGIIAALDGAFPGEHPAWQASITPTGDGQADYTLTRWQVSDGGVLGERIEVARFRVTVEALPRQEGDPVPPPEPEPEPDPLTEAITTLDAQVPPEGDGTAEVSAPAARVVLTAARSLRE